MTILVRPKKLKTYGNTKANYVNNTLKMWKKQDYEKFPNMTTNTKAEFSNSKKNYFEDIAVKLCDPKGR